MLRTFCKSKVTGGVITGKNMHYSGSIGIDKAILEAADILPGEQVHVLNLSNGERLSTYAIEEDENSGNIVIYGPAARKGEVGDSIVLLSYAQMETKESFGHKIQVITLTDSNNIKK